MRIAPANSATANLVAEQDHRELGNRGNGAIYRSISPDARRTISEYTPVCSLAMRGEDARLSGLVEREHVVRLRLSTGNFHAG